MTNIIEDKFDMDSPDEGGKGQVGRDMHERARHVPAAIGIAVRKAWWVEIGQGNKTKKNDESACR